MSFDNQWIEWDHSMENPVFHCKTCIVLDKCLFVENKKPPLPLHLNCHCEVKPVSFEKVKAQAKAFCDINKFIGYIFSNKPEYVKNGKKAAFEKRGFYLRDSELLKEEFEKQALEKYLKGEYKLGKLNKYGQHIDIVVSLNLDGRKMNPFRTGWMIKKNGRITNNTPFTGFIE